MQFHNSNADLFVPDGTAPGAAIARTTHLCIAAHQDDIEIMAYHGIAECFGRKDKWFTGVVVTNGAGSPRSGIYGSYTDEEMQKVRLIEQRKAAYVGDYACQIQLGYSSAAVKSAAATDAVDDLKKVVIAARPEIVYLHNPADKHDTHIGVLLRCYRGLARRARPTFAPKKFTAAKCGAIWTGSPTTKSRFWRRPPSPTSRPPWWEFSIRRSAAASATTWPPPAAAWPTPPTSPPTAPTRRPR